MAPQGPDFTREQRSAIEHILHKDDIYRNCHTASLRVVKTGLFGEARVARGTCPGVGGQHSWVALSGDCYDEDGLLLDLTLWSCRSDVEKLWTGTMRDLGHRPHGKGSIWAYGRPAPPTGPILELEPPEPWSEEAERFLDILGPLDEQGWRVLANCPVEEWPAAEILSAINHHFGPWVPMDIIGMLTDENPGGAYLANVTQPSEPRT